MAEIETHSRMRYESTGGVDLPESETEYFYSRRASMDEFSDTGAHNNYLIDHKEVLNELNQRKKVLESSQQIEDGLNGTNTPISRPLSRSSFVFVANK